MSFVSRLTPGACVLVALMSAPGCALLSKADPSVVRYFSLDQPKQHAALASGSMPSVPKLTTGLRLGPVTGAVHIEERLVFRLSDHEIAYHRDLRWTEPPELCMKRQLAQSLFEKRGIRHVVGGNGPTLDVQLLHFDEIRTPAHLVRAQAIARLLRDHDVIWEVTLTVELPITEVKDGDPEVAVVEAFAQAMQILVEQIGDRVTASLDSMKQLD